MPFISLWRRYCLQCARDSHHLGDCPTRARCEHCNGNLMVEEVGRRAVIEPHEPWPKSRLGRPPTVRVVV